MKTTITRSLLALASAGALTLAGCSDAQDESQETMTSTATSTISEETSTQATATATEAEDTVIETTVTEQQPPAETETPAPPPSDTAAPPTTGASEELPIAPVGSEVTIAGQPATVCIYGDGWGTNVWAGNANTSCEFVTATHEVLIEGLNATTQNIRDNLRPQISVTSPVTGETYDMSCAPRTDELVSCTGGEGAEVFFY